MSNGLIINPYAYPTPNTITLGDTSEGGDVFPYTDGRLLVSKFTLSQAAVDVLAIRAFNGSASTAGSNCKGVILSDSAGVPGSTVCVSEPAACLAGGGWVYMPVLATVPLSTGDYWIGLVADSFQGRFGHDTTVGTLLRAEGFTYASPPGTWPGTADTYIGEASIYAVLEI